MIKKIKEKSFSFVKENFKDNLILSLILLIFTFLNIFLSSKQGINIDSNSTSNGVQFLFSISSLIATLLTASLTYTFYKIDNESSRLEQSITQSILSFNYYVKAFLFSILFGVFVWVSLIIIAILVIIFVMLGTFGIALSIILGIAAICGLIYFSVMFSQSILLIFRDLENNEWEGYISYFSKSYNIMKGHFWEYIFLNISLIGWYLLVVLTLGIANIFVVPYVANIKANYFRYLIKQD